MDDAPAPPVPSDSQRAAIEADPQPLLVLAGPGSGKTFCLIERIRFLIERWDYDPARICAFTFTNRAAEEIATRLARRLGPRAEQVKRGTIHAFCAELLREFGAHVGLQPGFGIVDEEYQLAVLRRLREPERWRRSLLKQFTAFRFCNEPLHPKGAARFAKYERFLADRNLVDFDLLVLKTAELFRRAPDVADQIRSRWACVLVDEFQDLNPVQYGIVRDLARTHRNIFAVGDDEQSIYSWAGADPQVFRDFVNDFALTTKPVHLLDNRRCPREVFVLARGLVSRNPPMFEDRLHADPARPSAFPVSAMAFANENEEAAWILDDLRRDLRSGMADTPLTWGDFAVLYRRHDIGVALEAGFLTNGIPCRLAQGRALSEDPVVEYVIAALRVIANPGDPILRELFLTAVLPRTLVHEARTKADENRQSLLLQLRQISIELPKAHEDGKKIRRGLAALRNLQALRRRHTSATQLVEELLAQRVGVYRTVLEEHHDVISDPASHADVVNLAARLRSARNAGGIVWIPPAGGLGIALKGILGALDIRVSLASAAPRGSETITADDVGSLGLALGVFKAAQLVASEGFANAFRDFTTIDLETTGTDLAASEIVEIAATRVRDGRIVDQFTSLVKPGVPVEAAARRAHKITDQELATAPAFAEVWPRFRAFCGSDVLVAHNGYTFDFPILRRMAKSIAGAGAADLCTYDTLPLARDLRTGSAKLDDLARAYGIDPGQSHRALADTNTTALVFLALGEDKVARARKTALVNVLDQLGVALALSDSDDLPPEAQLFRDLARPYALGRYSECLEYYREQRAQAGDESIPTVEQLIDRLGGERLMAKIRGERGADDRYPEAMLRLRTILEQCAGGTIDEQIALFLERAVLSKWDGVDPERVNLLTLHSTKGLEFSRVYIVGVEDAQLPGGSAKGPSKTEVEEARRLLYVGMTRAKERLVLTRCETRGGKTTGGHQFLDEMSLSLAFRNPSTAGGPDPAV